MSYATLAQLKSALSITDTSQDGFLTDLLARVTDWIDLYTNRTWQGPQTVTDEEYDLPTNADGVFFLRRMDIVSIDTFKLGSQFNATNYKTLTAGQDFIWNSYGRILLPTYSASYLQTTLNDFVTPTGPMAAYGAMLISYHWGLSAVPPIVESICVDIAQGLYSNKALQGIKDERIGDYRIEYQDADMMKAIASTDSLNAIEALKQRHI